MAGLLPFKILDGWANLSCFDRITSWWYITAEYDDGHDSDDGNDWDYDDAVAAAHDYDDAAAADDDDDDDDDNHRHPSTLSSPLTIPLSNYLESFWLHEDVKPFSKMMKKKNFHAA